MLNIWRGKKRRPLEKICRHKLQTRTAAKSGPWFCVSGTGPLANGVPCGVRRRGFCSCHQNSRQTGGGPVSAILVSAIKYRSQAAAVSLQCLFIKKAAGPPPGGPAQRFQLCVEVFAKTSLFLIEERNPAVSMLSQYNESRFSDVCQKAGLVQYR